MSSATAERAKAELSSPAIASSAAATAGLVDYCLSAPPPSQGPLSAGTPARLQSLTEDSPSWAFSPPARAREEGGHPAHVKTHRRSSFASSLLGWGRSTGGALLQGAPAEGPSWAIGEGTPLEGRGGASWGPSCDSLDSEEAGALPPHWRAIDAAARPTAAAAPAAAADAAAAATRQVSKQPSVDSSASPSHSRAQQLQQQQQQKQQQQQQLSESVLQAIAIRKLQLLPLREWEDEQRARRNEFFRAIGEVVEAVTVAFRQGERDHQQLLKFFRARAKVDREAARALRHCFSNICGVQQQQQQQQQQHSSTSSRRDSGAAAATPGGASSGAAAPAADTLTVGPLTLGGGALRSPSSSHSVCSLSPRFEGPEGPLSAQGEAQPGWRDYRTAAAAENSSSNSKGEAGEQSRETETPPWLSKAYEQIHSDEHEGHTPVAAAAVAATAATAPVSHAAAAALAASAHQLLEFKGFPLLVGAASSGRRSSNSNSGDVCRRSNSNDSGLQAPAAAAAAAAAAEGSSSSSGGSAAALQQQLFGGARKGVSCSSWVRGLVEWTRQQALLQDALSAFSEKDLVKAHLEGLVLHYEREGTKEIVKLRQLEATARRADAASLEAWAAYVQLLDSSSEPSNFERQHLHRKKPPCCWLSEHKYRMATQRASEAIRQLMGGTLRSLHAFYALEGKPKYRRLMGGTWRCTALSQIFRAFVLKTYGHCCSAVLSLEGLADFLGVSLPGTSCSEAQSAAALAARQCAAMLEQLQLSAAAASPALQQTTVVVGEEQPEDYRKSLAVFSALSDCHEASGVGPPGGIREDSRGSQAGCSLADGSSRSGGAAHVRSAFNDTKDLYPLWLILSEEDLLFEGSPGLVPHPFRCRLLAAAAETLQGASPPPSSRLLLRRGPAQLQVKRIGSREGGKLDIQVTEKKRRGLLPRSSVVFRVSRTRECDEWLAAIEEAADDRAFLASAQDIRANVEVPLDAYDSPSFSFAPLDAGTAGPVEEGGGSTRAAAAFGLSHMQPFVAAAEPQHPDDGVPSSSMDEVSLDEHGE
ncbi:hypothetical protein Efla_003843 [Eimeria flavescens]